MNDKTSRGNGPEMTDHELDRLLDSLEAPRPSDLLRARVSHLAGGKRPAAAPPPQGGPLMSQRFASHARIAAALCLAALVGLAVWMPAPGSGQGGNAARAVASLAPEVATGRPSGAQAAAGVLGVETPDNGPALALVGGDGVVVSGVGLVRATWSAESYGGADDVTELDDIPLD